MILIIDDTPWLLDSIAETLIREGWEVDTAMNSGDAYKLAELYPYTTIVCDWDLGPNEPLGDAIVTTLRHKRPDTKFIIFSGLERHVPDGVQFVLKDNFRNLLEAIE